VLSLLLVVAVGGNHSTRMTRMTPTLMVGCTPTWSVWANCRMTSNPRCLDGSPHAPCPVSPTRWRRVARTVRAAFARSVACRSTHRTTTGPTSQHVLCPLVLHHACKPTRAWAIRISMPTRTFACAVLDVCHRPRPKCWAQPPLVPVRIPPAPPPIRRHRLQVRISSS